MRAYTILLHSLVRKTVAAATKRIHFTKPRREVLKYYNKLLHVSSIVDINLESFFGHFLTPLLTCLRKGYDLGVYDPFECFFVTFVFFYSCGPNYEYATRSTNMTEYNISFERINYYYIYYVYVHYIIVCVLSVATTRVMHYM